MANSDEITPLAGVSSKPKVEITSRNRNIEDLKSGEPLFSQGKKNVIQEESSSDEFTDSCSQNGDAIVSGTDTVSLDENVTQLFTELFELKKYDDEYQVSKDKI